MHTVQRRPPIKSDTVTGQDRPEYIISRLTSAALCNIISEFVRTCEAHCARLIAALALDRIASESWPPLYLKN